MTTVLPYFWMPNFVEATDSSARTLEIYKKKNETEHSEEKLVSSL